MEKREELKNFWQKILAEGSSDEFEKEDYSFFDDMYDRGEEGYNQYSDEAIITNLIICLAILAILGFAVFAVIAKSISIAKKILKYDHS
ncbi:hypothetical protein IKF25_03990 [Candidatus Saccharibacteria bacterium]|nr:hypothetical protein [Candidatus Saccharibacteria bacterium]